MPGNILRAAMVHVLITGFNLNRAKVMRSIKTLVLRGVSASLEPLITTEVTNAADNVGALANIWMKIRTVNSRPSVWVVDNGNITKLKGIASQGSRKQMWNDLVRTGIPQ